MATARGPDGDLPERAIPHRIGRDVSRFLRRPQFLRDLPEEMARTLSCAASKSAPPVRARGAPSRLCRTRRARCDPPASWARSDAAVSTCCTAWRKCACRRSAPLQSCPASGDGVIDCIEKRRARSERVRTSAMLEPLERVHRAFAGRCKIAGQLYATAKAGSKNQPKSKNTKAHRKANIRRRELPSAGRFFMKFRGPQALPNRPGTPGRAASAHLLEIPSYRGRWPSLKLRWLALTSAIKASESGTSSLRAKKEMRGGTPSSSTSKSSFDRSPDSFAVRMVHAESHVHQVDADADGLGIYGWRGCG